MKVILDIESTGLLNEADESKNATKIHCMCFKNLDSPFESTSFTDINAIKEFFKLFDGKLTIVGHNIVKYDIPLLEKLLNIKINARLIDTLGLSWYLYPQRIKHGLDEHGEELGIQKPPISDWQGISNKEQQILDYYENS